MTLFNSDDEDVTIDPNKDYFDELVGEGKKYKTNQDVGRALVEKDTFIERLKTENAGIRQELATRLKLEEAVEKIASVGRTPPPSNEPEPQAPEKGNGAAASPEDIRKIVAEVQNEESAKARREANLNVVENALKAAFGPGYQRTLKEQAKKLGLGESFLQNLAAEQPNAFLKLMDVQVKPEAPSTAVTAPRTVVSPEAFQSFSPASSVKTQKHFEEIRKKDPSRYWSAAVQNEMHREAIKQGESFFDL